MTDGSSQTYYDKKRGRYVLCEECGERLYLNDGFNRLHGEPLCKKCYRKRRNRQSVINYKKAMIN